MKFKKASFGIVNSEKRTYAVKINNIDNNDFFKLSFGRGLDDRRKVDIFQQKANSIYVKTWQGSSLAAIKSWIKEFKPAEFYASWTADSANYHDDVVKIYFIN